MVDWHLEQSKALKAMLSLCLLRAAKELLALPVRGRNCSSGHPIDSIAPRAARHYFATTIEQPD
jgi:hypothetical protein